MTKGVAPIDIIITEVIILWSHPQLQASIVLSINIAYLVHRQEVERVQRVAVDIGEKLKEAEHV